MVVSRRGDAFPQGDNVRRPYTIVTVFIDKKMSPLRLWLKLYRVFVIVIPPQRVGVNVIRDALQVFLVSNYMFVIP